MAGVELRQEIPRAEGLRTLADQVAKEDGVEAFGDSAFRALEEGTVQSAVCLFDSDDDDHAEPTLVGCALIIPTEGAELAVAPDYRRQGWGAKLLEAVLGMDPDVKVWAHGNLGGAQHLARDMRLQPVRDLWQMRADISGARRPAERPDISITELATETCDMTTATAVAAVNRAAFTSHPDQGALQAADISRRGGDLIVAKLATQMSGVMDDAAGTIGFAWIQHDPPELYVLGVAPEMQGQGLGGWLLAHALAALKEAGHTEAILYVEGNNAPAIASYERVGFVRTRADVQYQGRPDDSLT